MVRKTGEQQVYEADDRAQAKTLRETACATCQTQQVCTQVIGMDGLISRTAPRKFACFLRGKGVFCAGD